MTPTATVRHLIGCHVGIINRLSKYYPIDKIGFEMPKFSFMRMEDGSIVGSDFQYGRMHGYTSAKEYVRARDGGCCVMCGKPENNIHHLKARYKNGSDLPENLVCLCSDCHNKLHTATPKQREKLAVKLDKGLFKKYHHLSVLNTASPFIFKKLQNILGKNNVVAISGKQTSDFRQLHKLPKTHCIDAQCIANIGLGRSQCVMSPIYLTVLRFRRQNRQIIFKTTERSYKQNSENIAKNRHPRCEQKALSLADYRNQLESLLGVTKTRQEISKLSVKKSEHIKNNMDRILPGAVFSNQGKCYVLQKNTAGQYYVPVGNSNQRIKIEECKLILQNQGLVFC